MRQANSSSVSDVLVVGGGAAGLYAAISARTVPGIGKVSLLTPYELGTGGCSKKTHGVNAALNKNDSWEAHFADTYDGGGRLGKQELVTILCKEIATRIKELESWGVRFEKNEDQYLVGTYGGSSFSRSVHWFDFTGLEIVQELVKRVILSGCFAYEGRWVVDIIMSHNKCCGVVAYNNLTHSIEIHEAKTTIFATGGGACVYPIASISRDKLATGMLLGYMAGANLVDMEMVQFHPTGALLPNCPGNGSLLEEEMRSQGGRLLTSSRHRYMYDYDSRGELATRDIVARSTYLEILKGNGTQNGGVIFDISSIDKQTLKNRLPKAVKRLREWNIDLLATDEVEISPTAHFLMGGIEIDTKCQTTIQGLFACGEDAGGIHGANRLGGNGVAEALVFGHLAGISAAQQSFSTDHPNKIQTNEIGYYFLSDIEYKELDSKIKKIMWEKVVVVRWKKKLYDARNELFNIKESLKQTLRLFKYEDRCMIPLQLIPGLNLLHKLELSQIITSAAIARTNSIGAHYLFDDPHFDNHQYNTSTIASDGHPQTSIVSK